MKRLLVALGLCLVSGVAQAQEGVLYCTEDDSVGFKQVGESYTNGLFNQTRFTISLKGDHLTLGFNGKPRVYACETVFGNPKHHACSNGDGFYFSYNEENGRFTQARTYGYAFVDGDTAILSIGKCTAF